VSKRIFTAAGVPVDVHVLTALGTNALVVHSVASLHGIEKARHVCGGKVNLSVGRIGVGERLAVEDDGVCLKLFPERMASGRARTVMSALA
jgi:hypothetical protein